LKRASPYNYLFLGDSGLLTKVKSFSYFEFELGLIFSFKETLDLNYSTSSL